MVRPDQVFFFFNLLNPPDEPRNCTVKIHVYNYVTALGLEAYDKVQNAQSNGDF